ncbi:hypothetical protein OIX85_003853 [Vibrio parahaemolyticus]|uniref:hypothetical protein n=1 Tax=Vibrio alginolyticus TaxID=663 RepID=UPI0035C6BAAE|nr:hypothetical protein [Vibrio parahaemolyticus]
MKVDKKIFSEIEAVTGVDNAALFLAEATLYLDRLGFEGGVMGMTQLKFETVVNSGVRYDVTLACGEEYRVDLRDYAKYSELRTDHFKACLYAIGYIDAFSATIPSTKEGRFDLFALLFDHEADRNKYLSMTI